MPCRHVLGLLARALSRYPSLANAANRRRIAVHAEEFVVAITVSLLPC
jgi:hypothetical protein